MTDMIQKGADHYTGGGSKATTLMGVPEAQDLFHKAIAMSGGSAKVTRTHEQAQAQTEKVLASEL